MWWWFFWQDKRILISPRWERTNLCFGFQLYIYNFRCDMWYCMSVTKFTKSTKMEVIWNLIEVKRAKYIINSIDTTFCSILWRIKVLENCFSFLLIWNPDHIDDTKSLRLQFINIILLGIETSTGQIKLSLNTH